MSSLELINFTRGVPANESFPLDEMRDAAAAVLKDHGPAVLQYGPAAGFGPLREWIAGWQGVTPPQVVMGNGSLELVEFLCRHMVRPGDTVFTESPTYDRSILVFRRHGAEVTGVPLDNDGPNIDALEALLKKRVPKFFYVIADFQNPSGATCSRARRDSRSRNSRGGMTFIILEDAPYRMLRYRGTEEPTIFSFAPERTLAHEFVYQADRPGRSRGVHGRRRGKDRSDREGGRRHLHLTRLFRPWRHVGMVPTGVAAASGRSAEGALCAAAESVSGRDRATYAGCQSDTSRRRVLYFTDIAGRDVNDRCAIRRCKAESESG